MVSWKRDFASGLIILLPLLVTLYIVFWLYAQLAGLTIFVEIEDPRVRVALALLVFVLIVFAIGYLMRTALGSVLESSLDDVMNQLPGLRVVYNASKMAVETAVGGTDTLQAPVKLDTWNGLRMTAFKTGKTTSDGRDILFLPTAPNITTGFVLEVEPDRYTEVNESVEDALTRILSAGFGDTDEQTLPLELGGEEDDPDDDGSPDGETPDPSVAASEASNEMPTDHVADAESGSGEASPPEDRQDQGTSEDRQD